MKEPVREMIEQKEMKRSVIWKLHLRIVLLFVVDLVLILLCTFLF